MYADPRALEAPEIRHSFPHLTTRTTFGAPRRSRQRAKVVVPGASDVCPDHYVDHPKLAGLPADRRLAVVMMALGFGLKATGRKLAVAPKTVADYCHQGYRHIGALNAIHAGRLLGICPPIGRPLAVATDAECEVMRLVVAGMTSDAIAVHLDLPSPTVSGRITTLGRRTQTRNRVQTALWFRRYVLGEG